MEKLQRSCYKDFYETLQRDSEPDTARMEVHMPAPLLAAVDETAEENGFSSRSEFVRKKLKEEVEQL